MSTNETLFTPAEAAGIANGVDRLARIALDRLAQRWQRDGAIAAQRVAYGMNVSATNPYLPGTCAHASWAAGFDRG